MLIAVMGVTGSGKSTFIKNVTGIEDIKVGHGLCSETDKVQSYKTIINNKAVVLVDTPGFDDTFEDDEVVVERIADWLSDTYKSNRLLNGILYLHRIDAPRLGGSSSRSLRMLKEICGQDAYKNIVLATTFWDQVGEADGKAREKELLEEDSFWKKLIAEGARTIRMSRNKEAGKRLLEDMGTKATAILKIQKEMVEDGKSFEETTAATEIDREMTKLKLEQAETVRAAQVQADHQIAVAEADRIFREEEARAEHRLRLERHERQVALQRQREERRARERLAEICRQQQRALREKRLEAEKQQRELDALVQAEIEVTRRREAEIKRIEVKRRKDRANVQLEAIGNHIEIFNMGCAANFVNIASSAHTVLTRFCDICLGNIGASFYYSCDKCNGPDDSFDVCESCFRAAQTCPDEQHTFQRKYEADTLNGCSRAIRPAVTTSLSCDRCGEAIKGLYFHCCICDGDDFDMCLTCVMNGRGCRNSQHRLGIGSAPILSPEIMSGNPV
ncbi:P-loop containing nucleoside triphosphate hydrolase protein [Hyaloscypha sp. PMI_1271]|nr:P-loop containing nucleoside triphosphate hydrolase protein [Hyaloscypha sp. PMI_1271]